jgi:hypothetical protein
MSIISLRLSPKNYFLGGYKGSLFFKGLTII